MKKALRAEAIRLRKEQRLSYTQIRKQLGVAKSTLSDWLQDFPLTEEEIQQRQREGWANAEAARERYRNTMRRKKEARKQKHYERYNDLFRSGKESSFFAAGLMLYISEGSKKKRATISLANTDPRILRFFAKWLQDFFDVRQEELKAHLHLYEGMDLLKEKKFWGRKLGLQESQFYKPYITALKSGSFTYRESYRHGTCTLYAFGAERRLALEGAINAYLDNILSGE